MLVWLVLGLTRRSTLSSEIAPQTRKTHCMSTCAQNRGYERKILKVLVGRGGNMSEKVLFYSSRTYRKKNRHLIVGRNTIVGGGVVLRT